MVVAKAPRASPSTGTGIAAAVPEEATRNETLMGPRPHRLLARRSRISPGDVLGREGRAEEAAALEFPQLRRARSRHLSEVGDSYELADIESARRALNLALAIEAELTFVSATSADALGTRAKTPEDR